MKWALLRQKNGKAVGPDGLPAEVIKNQVCCTFFQSLFSACLKNLYIPTVWRHGIITPIPKNKTSDPRIPLNYRGISLLSVPYKAFCSILNQYILEWAEYAGILCEEQNGFRAGRSCLEHIFSLTSIIECRKKMHKPTFACFVDFSKAYDNVKHGLLWKKLQDMKFPDKMLRMLKCIYKENTNCVRVNESFTKPFRISTGLRQGCVLSPILFNLFINDLPGSIAATNEGVQFGDSTISSLLYADDLVMIADSEQALQTLIGKVHEWCSLWSIGVNSKKSAIVHFRLRSHPLTAASFTLGELVIPISSHYIYLGIPLDEHLTFQTAVHTRIEKSLCSFYALVGHLMKIGGSSYNVYKRLFDSMVAPILDYGAPVWSRFSSLREVEKVQNQVYRFFLGVGSKHPLAAASGDMCWMPTSCRHKLATVAFWRHLVQIDNNRICKKVYIECKRLTEEQNQDNWASQVKQILAGCGLQYWWHQSSCDGLSHSELQHVVTCCLFRLEKERWQTEVSSKPKLRLYVNFKTEYGKTEEYVQKVRVKSHRSLLARLRGGTAPLQIETGRYTGLPVEERICRSCNTGQVEDEQHFCVGCPALKEARAPLLHLLNLHQVDAGALSDKDKFIAIMQNLDSRIAKLLFNMFLKRNS